MFWFVLVTMLGTKVISTEKFYDINRCLYFAEKLNRQPLVPQPDNKNLKITSYCKPIRSK